MQEKNRRLPTPGGSRPALNPADPFSAHTSLLGQREVQNPYQEMDFLDPSNGRAEDSFGGAGGYGGAGMGRQPQGRYEDVGGGDSASDELDAIMMEVLLALL